MVVPFLFILATTRPCEALIDLFSKLKVRFTRVQLLKSLMLVRHRGSALVVLTQFDRRGPLCSEKK